MTFLCNFFVAPIFFCSFFQFGRSLKNKIKNFEAFLFVVDATERDQELAVAQGLKPGNKVNLKILGMICDGFYCPTWCCIVDYIRLLNSLSLKVYSILFYFIMSAPYCKGKQVTPALYKTNWYRGILVKSSSLFVNISHQWIDDLYVAFFVSSSQKVGFLFHLSQLV